MTLWSFIFLFSIIRLRLEKALALHDFMLVRLIEQRTVRLVVYLRTLSSGIQTRVVNSRARAADLRGHYRRALAVIRILIASSIGADGQAGHAIRAGHQIVRQIQLLSVQHDS